MASQLAALGAFGLFLLRIWARSGSRGRSCGHHPADLRHRRALGADHRGGRCLRGTCDDAAGLPHLVTFGAGNALGTMLSLTVFRELGPVLTAILFCGRAGSRWRPSWA